MIAQVLESFHQFFDKITIFVARQIFTVARQEKNSIKSSVCRATLQFCRATENEKW